jgi:hypothetical protein
MSTAGRQLLEQLSTVPWDLLDRHRSQAASALAGLSSEAGYVEVEFLVLAFMISLMEPAAAPPTADRMHAMARVGAFASSLTIGSRNGKKTIRAPLTPSEKLAAAVSGEVVTAKPARAAANGLTFSFPWTT